MFKKFVITSKQDNFDIVVFETVIKEKKKTTNYVTHFCFLNSYTGCMQVVSRDILYFTNTLSTRSLLFFFLLTMPYKYLFKYSLHYKVLSQMFLSHT